MFRIFQSRGKASTWILHRYRLVGAPLNSKDLFREYVDELNVTGCEPKLGEKPWWLSEDADELLIIQINGICEDVREIFVAKPIY